MVPRQAIMCAPRETHLCVSGLRCIDGLPAYMGVDTLLFKCSLSTLHVHPRTDACRRYVYCRDWCCLDRISCEGDLDTRPFLFARFMRFTLCGRTSGRAGSECSSRKYICGQLINYVLFENKKICAKCQHIHRRNVAFIELRG